METHSTTASIASFDTNFVGKILDPIHGIIRITDIEKKIINHPLFQRLRSIKQNTFLYKIFPSANHTRFEHSLGVMHLSYEIIKNLDLNTIRYKQKYGNEDIYSKISSIPHERIQELRIAALLHDVGHGPLAHQFDTFAITKESFKAHISESDYYEKILQLVINDRLDHEIISCLFVVEIMNKVDSDKKYNIDNIIKIIEKKYNSKDIMHDENDLHPLFTSIISSCPIDADRMDYLLRDSYFSGVKYGIYDYSRLLMSIIPIVQDNKVYLAFKESGIDPMLEFINARSNLFSQVYFHKTNRALSKMLEKACESIESKDEFFDSSDDQKLMDKLIEFYEENSDQYFLEKTLLGALEDCTSKKIIESIINRNVWKKAFERKITFANVDLSQQDFGDIKNKLLEKINEFFFSKEIKKEDTILDIISEDNFKDISKSEIKLLKKINDSKYIPSTLIDSKAVLQSYHHIKYFIRIFVSPEKENLISILAENYNKIDDIISNLHQTYTQK